MEIKIKDEGDNARVQLVGKLDPAGVNAVSVPFNALVEAKRGLIVDISGLTFLTSYGIRMLLAASKTLVSRGGRLILLNPNDMVNEVLAVTGTDSIIPVARSEKEAQGLLTIE